MVGGDSPNERERKRKKCAGKPLQHYWIDVQPPFQILAHFPLHLVDFSQLEHALQDNHPQLVRVFMTKGLTRWKIK